MTRIHTFSRATHVAGEPLTISPSPGAQRERCTAGDKKRSVDVVLLVSQGCVEPDN